MSNPFDLRQQDNSEDEKKRTEKVWIDVICATWGVSRPVGREMFRAMLEVKNRSISSEREI